MVKKVKQIDKRRELNRFKNIELAINLRTTSDEYFKQKIQKAATSQ
jgi:hypothetical protein